MIKYNSDIGDKIISDIKEASQIINNDISNKISSDFSDLTRVGLFSSQLNNIISASRGLAESYDEFASAISQSSAGWTEVVKEAEKVAENFVEKVETNQGIKKSSSSNNYLGGTNRSNRTNTGSNTNPSGQDNSNIETVSKGREVSINDVKELIAKMDSNTMPILLQKINNLSEDESIVDLIINKEKSSILTVLLKKILGDTTEGTISVSLDTEDIQKIILEKINKDGLDLTTKEGKEALDKYLQEVLNMKLDDTVWYKSLYGDNVRKVDLSNMKDIGGTWVVAKTNQDFQSYDNYVLSKGVKQDSNKEKWGDKCLSFAEAHAYDLYHNTKTPGQQASEYTRGGYTDFMDDDKQVVLSKIYDEITSGRPVVLQVNGNKAGTSRHFVTVVGFKDGVISGATLKESDLLIIDSWDGKIERMDTSTSRFMTSGAQCRKTYTGYRLRVFKT